jgi:hypothetical protein
VPDAERLLRLGAARAYEGDPQIALRVEGGKASATERPRGCKITRRSPRTLHGARFLARHLVPRDLDSAVSTVPRWL